MLSQDKNNILIALNDVLDKLETQVKNNSDAVLFKDKGEKWNNAQIIDHLAISFGITAIGFASPKFLLKAIGGQLGRNKRNYDEVVFQYQLKLNEGAKAPLPYLPKISLIKNKTVLDNFWNANKTALLKSIDTWNDKDLDVFVLPHPILGKTTLREMLYFTIYHCKHHLQQMDK
ncbi:MAG: DinB family protein [Chitinophagales bacterium]|nr:DinB family protein [Chitinophagales bacterium]